MPLNADRNRWAPPTDLMILTVIFTGLAKALAVPKMPELAAEGGFSGAA